ncbi:hypothetical protein EUTSA_v10020149mg [Eutrema salsugineum]|uniref:RRM domain-containing protein n=1 Tax=Eutrema salsugineum TaxID=72664 RepID=V4M5E9_EUTSA|nr:uncharacterized protein LOC18025115 [Eutrema salsugineum]ESQ47488.1 hypothetical protein EUTSA_v10020149mg [Eutrema salsugineum]
MAMGRLLSPKLTPHFSTRGFVPLTRKWLSSSLEDGRKFERLPDSKASVNKDIGQKGMHWYSLGGLLTNLKQKITGNMLLLSKTSSEESVSPKTPMVPSEDEPATKVVSLQDVAENKNCIPPNVKEESVISEMVFQDASQRVAAGKRESASVNKERLDSNNSLDDLELRLIQAERVNLPEEPISKDASLGFLSEEASESLASSEENIGKLQPEKGQSGQKESHQNKLSSMFMNRDPDKEVELRLRFEALSNSSSGMSTKESCSDVGDQHGLFGKMPSDPIQKMKNISKEKDTHWFSEALQNPESLSSFPCHDRKSGDLPATSETKSTLPFRSPRGTVVPVAVSKDLSIKMVMECLKVPTDNGRDADANSLNPNDGEGKCVLRGNSVTEKSDRLFAAEEEESLCTQATLAATTPNPELTNKSLDALSVGEHSPNKVCLRFLPRFDKEEIVKRFSEFGAVLDFQEIPSFDGCYYKDAVLTFETHSAVKKALKKAVVMVKNYSVIVEATSQEDNVEKICIPDLIGDPDVPIALLKEPTRTVKIHPLAHGISSNQIKEALRFCRSDISKFILGSSKTAAFVEFETEDGKERALAEHSISIFNKQLFISRIDIPRTTVARISHFSKPCMSDIRKLCAPYGKIKQLLFRGDGIADVHFDVSEWPNMHTILNSMNGMEIDGMKWVVRPATTVIPHEILKVLWEDPQGKRYVKGLIQNLVREIEQPLDAAPIAAMHTLL